VAARAFAPSSRKIALQRVQLASALVAPKKARTSSTLTAFQMGSIELRATAFMVRATASRVTGTLGATLDADFLDICDFLSVAWPGWPQMEVCRNRLLPVLPVFLLWGAA
jgi:hypothetical protein